MSTRAVGHNVGNSIHIRGDIDVTNLVCVPCKKKHGGAATCYAHTIIDGKGICVFCEDGEPCMHEQRQARAAKNPQIVKANLTPGSGTVPREAHNLETSGSTPVPATSSKVAAPTKRSPIQLLADRLKAEGLPETDIRAALVGQGYKARDIKRVLPEPQVQPKEKSMNTAIRPNGHAPAATPRLCKCDCGGIVPAENRFSYIKGHMSRGEQKQPAIAGKKRGRPSNASRVAAGETPIRAVPAPVVESQFSLQVTEAQLDRFLVRVDWNAVIAKLPAEMKLQLANHYFAAGLDQVEVKAEAAAA